MPSQQDDSSAAFEALALPLLDRLYNFAHWLTGNREDAEDLVQDTFLKGLRGFRSFQPGTNFRAWMYRILRNTFLSSRSGPRAKTTVPVEPGEDGLGLAVAAETPETILIESATRELVWSAIEHLPVHGREVILLCDLEEMSYRDIAEALSIPLGTVMSRLARARQAMHNDLRKTLQPISAGATQPQVARKRGASNLRSLSTSIVE